ncbi:MAG: PAS domain-containing protein [Pseudohongiellaceae bacterium]
MSTLIADVTTLGAGIKVKDLELTLVRHDRTTFPARLLVSQIEVRNSQAFAVMAISDLTEARATETKILEHQDLLRQLAENISDVFWVKNAKTNQIEYVSSACNEVLGLTEQECYSNKDYFTGIIHLDDRERIMNQRKVIGNLGLDLRYRIIKPDGEECWVRERLQPMIDASAAVYRTIGIIENITESKIQDDYSAQTQRLEAIVKLTDGIAQSRSGS